MSTTGRTRISCAREEGGDVSGKRVSATYHVALLALGVPCNARVGRDVVDLGGCHTVPQWEDYSGPDESRRESLTSVRSDSGR